MTKKRVTYQIRGHQSAVGTTTIYRLMPNQYAHHVGHFVFLDYIPPFMLGAKHFDPGFAHPHRGIATLSYILSGEIEHFDSRGNHGTVNSGGVQWMKAGNGIIHNETLGPDSNTNGRLMHGFQFWMNLPAKNKQEDPDYIAVQANELPVFTLEDDAGWLKTVVGEFGGQSSKIPTYSQLFLHHIHLNAGKRFELSTEPGLEYAAFLPQLDLAINDSDFRAGDLIGFDDEGGSLEFVNNSESDADIILFGGEKYTEPFVARGPFVMSTREEIIQANADFAAGKYGEMVYPPIN